MKRLELNIQLFGETTVDAERLTDANTTINKVASQVEDSFGKIQNVIKTLQTDESFQSTAGTAINSAFTTIAPYFRQFQTNVVDLGKFISYVVTTFSVSDEEMKNEYEAWSETIKSVVSNVKSGFTGVATGYTTGQYISDLSSSARNIVKETTSMVANTGKLYSSATGKSVLTSIKDFGDATVGTFKTLFGFIGKNNSIARSFVNAVIK